MKLWIDSIYTPWKLLEDSILPYRMDSIVKAFDIRALNDTLKKIDTFAIDSLPAGQIRVRDILALSHHPYIGSIEPYYISRPLKVLRNNVIPQKKSCLLKQEQFSLLGRKLLRTAQLQGSRPLGIVITREISSNGRVFIRKTVY